MLETWHRICEGLQLLADIFTITLGGIALWNIIFNRKKISAFVQLLSSTILNERVKKIKETLGALANLNFDRKEDRPEIFAIIGGIAGQIKQFGSYDPQIMHVHDEIHLYLDKKKGLTEPLKRKLMFELHDLLDAKAIDAALKILENKNGQ